MAKPDYVTIFDREWNPLRDRKSQKAAILAVARAAMEHCAQIADALAEAHRMAIIGEAAHEIRRQAGELK